MAKGNIRELKCWIVLAAATIMNLTMGVSYCWSIIAKALVTDWQWTNVQASLPYAFYIPTLALMMFFAGRLQDKLGPRLVANLGGVCMGTGMILCGFVHTPLLMVMTYSLTGIGNSLCFSTTMPTSIKWFPPEKRGIISGIVISGVALSAVYFAPIFDWLLAYYGISNSFQIFGIVVCFVMISMAQFLSNPPENYVPKMSVSKYSSQTYKKWSVAKDVDWREMITTAVFYKFWLIFFVAASAGLMIIAHITTIALKQANWKYGFYLVILFAIFNTIGRIAGGFLADRYDFLNIIKTVFFLQAVNFVFFVIYISPILLALGTMLTAFCYGSIFPLVMYGTTEYFGIKNFGGNYGLLYSAWGFAGLLGPLIAGWIVDLTGRYCIAYIISASLLIVTLLLAFTIKPQDNKCEQSSA